MGRKRIGEREKETLSVESSNNNDNNNNNNNMSSEVLYKSVLATFHAIFLSTKCTNFLM